jgi:hypothetical protein
MAKGVICQACGVEAPTKYVEFYYNIGMLVARMHKHIKGNLCKRCIHKYFWQFTLKDIVLGWWGMISIIVTPIFLINNVARYLAAMGLEATPADARPPQLTAEAIAKLAPCVDEIRKRLTNREALTDVAISVARTANVTPGQVVLYVRALAQAEKAQALPMAKGFPVVPLANSQQGSAPQANARQAPTLTPAEPPPLPPIPLVAAAPPAVAPAFPPDEAPLDLSKDIGIE